MVGARVERHIRAPVPIGALLEADGSILPVGKITDQQNALSVGRMKRKLLDGFGFFGGLHKAQSGCVLPATDILASAKELSGFSALAHPYGNGRFHCIADEMRTEILALLDGIEICNGVQSHRRNDKANLLAQLTKLLRIGGSDAHVACACGHVCTYAPGHDAPSFLDAVGRGTSAVLSYPFSIKEALEDGMTIAMRYLWHAMHRQKVWI